SQTIDRTALRLTVCERPPRRFAPPLLYQEGCPLAEMSPLTRFFLKLVIVCLVGVTSLAAPSPQANCQEAVAPLQAAIRANPKSGENRCLFLSQCYVQLGDPAKAQATLRAGLRAYPAAPVLERALGQLLFRAKYDSSEAGTLLGHAAKMLPRD